MTETTDLHHSIDANHVRNIGEQSVSDRVQAVIEIVKNSYDADALNCTVKFFARSGGSGTLIHVERIEISDDGTGMTLDDIKNKWMRLATDSKVKEFTSKKFGRRVSGQKGMGHFATQKLGSKVTIISNPEFNDADKTFILYTDWSKYISGLSFADIPNKLVTVLRNSEEAKKLHTYGNGITIEITGLKEDWTKDDVEKVQRHLGALQIPKFLRDTEENVFRTQVEANFDVENLPDTDITDYAPWTIEAHLRGNKINYKISELDYSTKKKILAKPVKNLDSRGTIDVKSQCGDADFHLYFYPGSGKESGSINDLLRTKGPGGWMPKKVVKDRAHLQNVMKSTAGVKIFHDNIRIRPYGDPRKEEDKALPPSDGDMQDWLALAWRARNVHGQLRLDQVIGYVLLTREKNPGIVETTTRQALVQNSAFRSVKDDFAIPVIKQLETYIKKRKEEFNSSQKSLKPAALVASETRQLEEFLADANLNEQEKSEAQSKLNAIKKHTLAMEQEIKQVEEDRETAIEMYRNLSSLGISALSFHHEIMEPLGRMDVRQGLLQRNWGKWDDARKLECNTDEKNDVETIIDLNSYIKQFASLFSGKMGTRRKRQEINPKEEIAKLKMGFEKLLAKYAINFSIAQGGGGFDGLYLHSSSFQSVILNLIGNSINALQSVDRKDKWIKLEIEKKFGHLQIRVSDNGIGVKESDRERIFEHHITTKNNGTGMGLTIVREILEYDYGGTIVVEKSVGEEDKKGSGGTTFLISIPLRNLEKKP